MEIGTALVVDCLSDRGSEPIRTTTVADVRGGRVNDSVSLGAAPELDVVRATVDDLKVIGSRGRIDELRATTEVENGGASASQAVAGELQDNRAGNDLEKGTA